MLASLSVRSYYFYYRQEMKAKRWSHLPILKNSLLTKLFFCLQYKVLSTIILGFPGGSDSKKSACNAGDLGSTPELGRSPGEANSNPLQYSCLENPMDRGAWWTTVHGVAVGHNWATSLFLFRSTKALRQHTKKKKKYDYLNVNMAIEH